jgi:hypothetical protein
VIPVAAPPEPEPKCNNTLAVRSDDEEFPAATMNMKVSTPSTSMAEHDAVFIKFSSSASDSDNNDFSSEDSDFELESESDSASIYQ